MITAGINQSRTNYNRPIQQKIAFKGVNPLEKAVTNVVQKNIFSPEENILLNKFHEKYNFAKKKPVQWAVKRTIDYTLASTGLIAASPILVVSGALIKLESKGPVILKQERIGEMGKKIKVYKFRTMYENSPQYTLARGIEDKRVTKIGKFLRKFSLDDLLQLINVLKKEMSLTGPRPLLEEDVRELLKLDPNSIRRAAVLPGARLNYIITNQKNPARRIATEKDFLENWNLINDLKILLNITKTIISGKNS